MLAITYKKAWAEGHRCIIPADAFYEPNYESGAPVRWRIHKRNREPMGIAEIYRRYASPGPDTREMFAFSMLTVNADDHPFMKLFHAPGDEKRMVVILEPEDFEGWLTCPVAEAKERYASSGMASWLEAQRPCPSAPRREQSRLRRNPPTRRVIYSEVRQIMSSLEL